MLMLSRLRRSLLANRSPCQQTRIETIFGLDSRKLHSLYGVQLGLGEQSWLTVSKLLARQYSRVLVGLQPRCSSACKKAQWTPPGYSIVVSRNGVSCRTIWVSRVDATRGVGDPTEGTCFKGYHGALLKTSCLSLDSF